MPIGYGKSFYDPRGQLDVPHRAGAGAWRPQRSIGRAARCSADRARSTRWCYVRGQAARFRRLGRRAAIPAGAGTTCCRYFSDIEDYATAPTTWRGAGGPLHVSATSRATAIRFAMHICAPARKSGLRAHPTSTARTQEGVGLYQITTRNGLRMSAARAYLWPAMTRGQPARRNRGAGDAHPVRRAARGRRGISSRRREHDGPRRPRGHPVRQARSIRRNCCSFPVSAGAALLKDAGIAVVHDSPAVGAQPAGPSLHRLISIARACRR